jgi:hypothetical protein
MILDSPHHQTLLDSSRSVLSGGGRAGLEGNLNLIRSSAKPSMERHPNEYPQPGLPSPHPSSFGDTKSEGSSADHSSAAQYPTQQDIRGANYSTSANSNNDYPYTPSTRSGSFPEHIQRPYHTASNQGSGSSAAMAQQPNSPSMPQADGRSHPSQQVKSDNSVPIDPSITAPSPTYAYGQHSPYAPPGDMGHNYAHGGNMYEQPRPHWNNYGQHSAGPLTPASHVFPPTPSSAPPQPRPNQVSTPCQAFPRELGARRHLRW